MWHHSSAVPQKEMCSQVCCAAHIPSKYFCPVAPYEFGTLHSTKALGLISFTFSVLFYFSQYISAPWFLYVRRRGNRKVAVRWVAGVSFHKVKEDVAGQTVRGDREGCLNGWQAVMTSEALGTGLTQLHWELLFFPVSDSQLIPSHVLRP